MEKLYTPEQAAEILAVTPRAILEWLRRGKLKGLKLGRLWRIREGDLKAFIDQAGNSMTKISKKMHHRIKEEKR
jgi:excisionase family DNA binding protein